MLSILDEKEGPITFYYHWKAQDVLLTIQQGLIENLKRVKADACEQNVQYRGQKSMGWISGG